MSLVSTSSGSAIPQRYPVAARPSAGLRGLMLLVGGLLLAACGRTAEVGNGSSTNWLKSCDENADCGGAFLCVAGACTPKCDSDDLCNELRDGASCVKTERVAAKAFSCEGASVVSVCAAPCESEACASQGRGYACERGLCVPAACDDVPPVYEPCAGKKAGASCSLCDPLDEDCIETQSVKHCTEEGKCVQQVLVDDPYSPCESKTCGESCSLCPPDDADCVEDSVLRLCDAGGKCTEAPVSCDDTCAELSVEECEATDACVTIGGRQIAAMEVSDEALLLGCMPADSACPEVETCGRDAAGTCFWFSDGCLPQDIETVSCSEGACCIGSECNVASYDPCAGKGCGDGCSLCAPDDAGCTETAEIKQCDALGECRGTAAVCACEGLSAAACSDAGCSVVYATPTEVGGEQAAVGCLPADVGCDDAITCALDESGACWTFSDGCIPTGFDATSCSSAECCQGEDCSYDACQGKSCGESCTLCAPNDPDCAETAELKQCTATGECQSGEAQCCAGGTCEPIVNPRVESFGYSFGECLGECLRTMTVDDATSELSFSACYHSGICRRENVGVLTEEGQAALNGAATSLEGMTLADVYGCPDCTDGGATTLNLNSDMGSSKHVYEFGAPPLALAAVDQTLSELLTALDTCQSHAWLSLADCKTAADAEACGPMDVVLSDADCALLLGYSWNGAACEAVMCDCSGEDCDALYPTLTDCQTERAACQ